MARDIDAILAVTRDERFVTACHDVIGDISIQQKAQELINLEQDPEYRKKYASVFRQTSR